MAKLKIAVWVLLLLALVVFMAWLTAGNWTECRLQHSWWYCFQALG